MSKDPTLEKHENGVYYIHWIEGRRTKRTSTGEREMVKAQIFFGQWLANEQRATTKIRAAGLTFAEVWDFYVEDGLAKRVNRDKIAALRDRLCRAFGDLQPHEIGQAHIDKYVRNRRAGRIGTPGQPSTIWLEVGKAKAAVNHAIKRRKLPATSRLEIDPLEAPEARDRWLRPEEFERLRAAAEAARKDGRLTRVERFLALSIETAARREVIEKLTWAQVDLEAGIIHYHRRGDQRTKKKRPSVPISKNLRAVLERAQAERMKGCDYVLDTPGAIYKPLVAVAEAAGVPDVYPHVMRHTAATWMARRGVPLWKIAGILGNSMQMVEQVYAKHSPDGLADAVEMISGGRSIAA